MMTRWHVLVHFIENFNDEMALLTKLLVPEQVILVTSESRKSEGKLQQVIDYMKAEFAQIMVEVITYELEEPLGLMENLKPHLNKQIAVNLAGTSPLEALLITNLRESYSFTMLYPDIRQNRLYIFEKNKLDIQVLSQVLGLLEVKDYLSLGGGIILQDEKSKYETSLYKGMLDLLLNHYEDTFSMIRHLFKPTYLHFSPSYEKEFYFEIASSDLSEEQKNALNRYLEYLNNLEWVKKFDVLNMCIRVYAQNKEIEHYLSSGAWLEHITYYYMKSIKKISDVHTGFKFAWHMQERHIHNELDVVATLENRLVCISCKDTDKYDYQTLNELEVYSTRLGGPETIKILVTTMPPVKSSTLDRARGMGIHIVQIEDSLKSLYDKLNGLV